MSSQYPVAGTASQHAAADFATAGTPVPTYDVYVDSNNGNDHYNGASASAPLRTLAAGLAAAVKHGNGVRVGLASDSYWRQSLDLSALTSVVLEAVGTGPAPIIDGADIVTAWTKTSGRTNVYQATISHNATGTSRLTIYENGNLLIRVTDQATCDSTAGSFVDAKGSDGSPVTIYLHPVTAGSPASNGSLYEVTVRAAVLILGPGATVTGIQTMRQIENNGSLDAVNQTGATVSRVLARNGTKHTLGLGSGTATDCIVALADPSTAYEPSNTAFIAFLNDGTGQSATWRRCGVILQPGGVNDFYSHGGAHPLAAVHYEDVWSLGLYYAEGADTCEGGYWRGSISFPLDRGTVTRTLMYSSALGSTVSTLGVYGALAMTDCALYAEERYAATPSNANEVFRPQGPGTLSHCSFSGLSSNTNWFANDNTNTALNVHYCVFDGGTGHVSTSGGGTYVGDYNVFRATNLYNAADQIECSTPAGYKQTLAAWQTYSGQDLHSVYLKASDQTAGNTSAFWLGVKNAASGTDLTTVGPVVGDWRINPAARVYAANNTAYTGTFPDGTPITQAGPQTYRDRNARASATGAPTAWPVVPATLADAQAYTLNPNAWEF